MTGNAARSRDVDLVLGTWVTRNRKLGDPADQDCNENEWAEFDATSEAYRAGRGRQAGGSVPRVDRRLAE